MEAMACGCAVVASNVGGNLELAVERETELAFEAGNAAHLASRLKLLIEDAPLSRRLVTTAAALIRNEFSAETSARQMEQIYSEFLPGT